MMSLSSAERSTDTRAWSTSMAHAFMVSYEDRFVRVSNVWVYAVLCRSLFICLYYLLKVFMNVKFAVVTAEC